MEVKIERSIERLKNLIVKYKSLARNPFSLDRDDYISEADTLGIKADISEELLALDETNINLPFLQENFPKVVKSLSEKKPSFKEFALETIVEHPSVNHPIYERLINGQRLDRDGLFRFCAGYHDMAQGYLQVAAAAILYQGIKDQRVMIEMTKTLHSELGFGDPKQVHHEYFLLFPESQKISKDEILKAQPVQASEKYNRELINVYSGDFLEFLGAQVAFEIDAKEMIRKIYEAARRYTKDPKDLSYFHLHLWFEDAHVDWAEQSAKPYLSESNSRDKIEFGFNMELDLKKEWLDGLYQYVFRETI